jgi:enhancing lycopene biosynthesis protein 2
MMKIAVILSGCGFYDGSEIQEAVLSLLAINQAGHEYQCFAPNIDQHHCIDHRTGEPMAGHRNVLTESARLARGDILPSDDLHVSDFDALWLPGGFGVAKNLTQWAQKGPDGIIEPSIEGAIQGFVRTGKPIAALCMAPTTVAQALKGRSNPPSLTVGNLEQSSPYDIKAINQGLIACGSQPVDCRIGECVVDTRLKIVSAPCYMMTTDIGTIAAECRHVMSQVELLAARP